MLFLLPATYAASLDNLEVGGPTGTPTTTDGAAAWWNPAGYAAGSGTRILVEGAPTFASVTYQRADPNGGNDVYKLSGVVPYAGVATDFGVHGLGFGAGLAVPFVRGAAEVSEPGPGAAHMRDGSAKALYLLVGGGYEIADRLAFGGSVAVVRSTWVARVNQDTLPDLAAAIEARGETADYTDADLENPDYTATLQFDELAATELAFNAGLRLKIDPGISIGLAYVHGATLDHTGGLQIQFGCPPDDDSVGQYAASVAGVCNSTVNADASIKYTLPNRLHGGIAWEPDERLRLEAMAGWVHWSVFSDFDITVSNADIQEPEGKALIEQSRKWARANVDSGWGGLDVKVRPTKMFMVGGRLLYDASAIPDEALSTNNYDANAWMLSATAAVRPLPQLEIGASWTHHFLADREVTNSGFYQTLEGDSPEDRWNYPHANGTYSGVVDRIGVQGRVLFGERKPEKKKVLIDRDG